MDRLNDDMRLRSADVQDIEVISRFNSEMAFETEGISLDRNVLLLGVSAVIADPNLGFYLIAEQAGAVIGQVLITREWSDWRNGMFWWIQSVFVEPHHRNTGVYTKMYNKIVEMAVEERYVCGLRLYVDKGNVLAKKVYSRLGMSESHYDLFEYDLG